MNNERQNEINRILKELSNYAKMSPLNNNFSETIYNYLRSYNLGNERDLDIKNRFVLWINRFQLKKTKCENTSNHPYWCQFINEKYPNQTLKESDPVKLYIPLKSDFIYQGVNLIFDFCEQNNIIHQSKVAARMRNDNVVLRIKNIDDAVKLINFVNENHYLKQGHLTPNPFCFNAGNVGLAIDNYNSYNENVSKFLANYIIYKKQTNTLSNVGINDFYNFVANNKLPYSNEKNKIYLEEIRNLILKSLESNDFNKFVKHYYSVSGNKKLEKELDISYEKNYKILDLLDEAIETTVENYNIDTAKNALYLYLKTGNTNGFSRYKNNNNNINYRGRLSSFDYKIIFKQLSDYCGTNDIKEIVNRYIKSNTRI